MEQTIDVIQSEEKVQLQFERDFKQWAEEYAPQSEHTALKAIAWSWYKRGRRTALRRMAEAMGKVSQELYPKDDFY